jgi:crotonobetaine/carnitine-CoA ligase
MGLMGEEIKFEHRTVGAILEDSAKRFGERPFIYFKDDIISFGQMNERADRVANFFQSIGLKRGDRVIILLDNCPEWLYTWFGLAKIGVIAVPLNTAHKGTILEYLINNADSRFMVTGREFVDSVKDIRNKLTTLRTLVLYPDNSGVSDLGLHTISYSELLNSSSLAHKGDIQYFDTIAIMYSSGTTGPSKGIVQPHNQYAWCGEQVAKEFNLLPDDVFYCWFPLFHIVPVGMVVMSALLVGSAIVLTDTFSVRRFWEDIRRYKATLTGGFATMLELLYKQPPRSDDVDNPLRRMIVAKPPESIRKDFEKRFDLVITDDYGMTEVEPISYSTVEERDRKSGSCGKGVQDLEVKIFDDHDNELGRNKIGEVVIRPKKPYIMMKEYYKMPDRTIETWRNLWFHTGDYGYQDEEGYIYFVDRKKDCIRRRGENISSYELESIINSHPHVLECAAVGVPSELGEEDIKVIVKLKEKKTLMPEELMRFCEQEMAFFMLPRYSEFIDEFPRTETSKILKRDLKTITEKTWDREKAGYKLKR